jgi:hypothetical protein
MVMPRTTKVLLLISALGAIAAVYGGVSVNEACLAIGLVVAFMALLFAPVIHIRAKKRQRLFERQGALLVWEYSQSEAERIAAREAKKTKKTSIQLSVVAAVCLAIIFAPFVALSETQATRYLLLGLGIAAVILPFTSIYFAPAYTVSLIKKIPSVSIIGRDYILMNNRYLGINDRADLRLVHAAVKPGADGEECLTLTYKFRMKYGNPISFPVNVPIPGGRNDQAKQFSEWLKTEQRA